MSEIRSAPCSACPYRQDAPPGLWAATEYEKLPPYDRPTYAQPTAAFVCHATPEHLCHGWAVVGGWDLLALRLVSARSASPIEIPEPVVPLVASGAEAAALGMSAIADPPPETIEVQQRLVRKYPRIRT